MKIFLLFAATLFFCNSATSQTKMVMTVNGKHDNIFGYTLDPDVTGSKESISILGPMQNLTAPLQFSFQANSPISNILISITGANAADNIIIKLTGVTVYAFKQYLSAYSNGTFNISSSGEANTEIKCKFTRMETQTGGSGRVPMIDPNNVIYDNKNIQSWETHPDATIKGVGGEISMEIPKGLRFNTNMEFYEAGDKKNRQASWFGNNKAKLLPGTYDVVIDSRDTIKNVPVELGKQTRLKMGVFLVSGYTSPTIENSTTHQKFTYGAPFKILLPAGTYYLNGNKKVPIVIKDGELTEL